VEVGRKGNLGADSEKRTGSGVRKNLPRGRLDKLESRSDRTGKKKVQDEDLFREA